MTYFLFSTDCKQSQLFPQNSWVNSKQVEDLSKIFEKIVEMKKFTKNDHGPLLAMANMTFQYINGDFPDVTKWTLHK